MSRSNKTTTGLRFLWIPGRKKHQHKGRFDTTYQQNVHAPNRPKKNQPWSISDGKSHGEDSELKDLTGDTTTLTSGLVPASCAVGASAVNHLADANGDAPVNPVGENAAGSNLDDSSISNTATLLVGEKRNGVVKKKTNINHIDPEQTNLISSSTIAESISFTNLPEIPWDALNAEEPSEINALDLFNNFQKDLDTIEKFDDDNDVVDATKASLSNLPNVPGTGYENGDYLTQMERYKKKNKEKKKKGGDGDKEEEASVKCLYYTLMCCECTIS